MKGRIQKYFAAYSTNNILAVKIHKVPYKHPKMKKRIQPQMCLQDEEFIVLKQI
jgi:hypothetical protein